MRRHHPMTTSRHGGKLVGPSGEPRRVMRQRTRWRSSGGAAGGRSASERGVWGVGRKGATSDTTVAEDLPLWTRHHEAAGGRRLRDKGRERVRFERAKVIFARLAGLWLQRTGLGQ